MIPIIGSTYAGAGGAAGAAAAKAARMRREEEEELTMYDRDDLEGWEFKIMRSMFGKFKKYEYVQELCKQEAQAGWELVEKFDDQRIRFKRRIENRKRDAGLGFDPYRTTLGASEGKMVVIIVLSIIAVIGLIAALALTVGKR